MVFVNFLRLIFEDIVTSTLIITLFTLVLLDYWRKHWDNQPPGPFNAPFLGYVSFFSCKRPEKLLYQLRGKYGNIFGFYLGEKYVVVLNDFATIRENLNREEFIGRPKVHPITMFEKDSLLISSGQMWKQEKRVALRTFHELGFGRKILEERIKDEISYFMTKLEKYEGSSFDMRKHLQISVNNNISSLLFGRRYDYSDPLAATLTDTVQKFEETNSSVDITSYFPYLKPIVEILGQSLILKCRGYSVIVTDIIRNEIKEEKKNMKEEEDIRSYLHGYLTQMDKDKENTTLTENALLGTAKVFYLAGTSTTVNTVEWLLLALITNPEIQARVQQEIDDVLLKKGIIDFSDQKDMHYIQAVILETLRWRTLVPLSVPRCCLKETTINGYRIPRNAIIFPNIWAAHNDTSIWEHPEEFNPNRFLNEDGKVINSNACISFSVGRRSCPGESLARLQIFHYFVTILGKYTVTLGEGEDLDLDGIFCFTWVPKPFKILLTPRN